MIPILPVQWRHGVRTLHQTYIAGLLAICLPLLTGCNVDYEAMAKSRVEYAKKNQSDIAIVAIQDSDNKNYINGITLAVEEINQYNQGVLGRPLTLMIEKGHHDFRAEKSTIRRIANNPKVSIVLGHTDDEVVIPASAIYERSQLLFFPPCTTTEQLTSRDSLFTFRMLPDRIHMVKQILNTSDSLGFKKIAVLYARADKYRELALLFKQSMGNREQNPVFEHSFFGKTQDYRPFLSDLKKINFDAIFLSAGEETASRLIQQMRELEINNPILVSGELHTPTFVTSVGVAGNKTIVPTAYDSLANTRINQNFVTHYQKKYRQSPDADAAQGYDSVMLFANKVEKAQSTLPTLLASTIRYSSPWTGVTGTFRFNKKGNIEGKKYFFQVLNNKKWQLLSASLAKTDSKK